jgi:hypothetical protein
MDGKLSMTNASTSTLTLDELRSAHDRMARREAEMMQLLGTETPERLVHDLRNVLNELTLLKATVALGEDD